MKISAKTLLSLAVAGFAAGVPAQEPEHQPPQAPAKAPQAQQSVQQLIEALGSDSYRTRMDAERALRARGADATAELKKAIESSEDAEVQWRARRVLREIENGGQSTTRRRVRTNDAPQVEPPHDAPSPGIARRFGGQDMREQFDSLFERFERDFGIDIPRARFFDDEFFRDLQQQMKDGAASQGMSMKVGPDGVRVEVQEKGADGKTETKVYEAPDMETFQKQYPDVLRRNGLHMGFGLPNRVFFNPPQGGGAFDQQGLTPHVWTLPRGRDAQPHIDIEPSTTPAPAPAPVGKRLGVAIEREIPPAIREYLELEDGVGLMIQDVQDDSLGQALGLQKGDIVTHLGSQTVGSPQDVQKALAPIHKGEKVEVRFVRKGVAKTASAEKTENAEASGEPDAAEAPRAERRGRKSQGDSGIR